MLGSQGPLSRIQDEGGIGPNQANVATAEHLSTPGVYLENLANHVLKHPDDVDAVVALATWALDVAKGEDW